VENLYRDVLRQDKANQYIFFGHWGTSQHFGPRAEHVDYPTRTRWRRLACHARQLAERHGIGLFHSTYISPLALPCDSLLSIHDILFETHPRFFRPAFVARSRFLVRLSALTARLVLTGSQYCRRVIIDRYRLPGETVQVVPPGVDLARFSPQGRRESARVVEKQLGVRDYILTVGRLEPRKNHVGLIKAYAYLHHRHRGLPPLEAFYTICPAPSC